MSYGHFPTGNGLKLSNTSKKFLGPGHLLPKTDKWYYQQSPIIDFFFVSCFDIEEVPRSPWKWNHNLLYFFQLISTFEQCVSSLSQCPASLD